MLARHTRTAAFAVSLLLIPAVNCQAPAHDAPQGDSSATTRLQVQSQLVLVPATVTVGKGDVLYELKASQFVVEDNGVPQQVRLDESDDVRPLSLVVAVQCSRSAVVEFDNLRGLPALLDAVVGGAPAEVAVIQFGTGEELLSGFTHDEEARNRALGKIAPCDYDGGANIFDAVDYANTLLEAHKATGRRAVLLISETRDHGSETKPETVIEELGRSNTIVDAAAFSPERDEMASDLKFGGGGGLFPLLLAALQAARKNAPKEFAQLSGGEYINFGSQKAFDHGMDTFANHLHNFYLLSFVPHFSQAGPVAAGLHKITVKLPEYPKATIRYRESYWAGAIEHAPDATK